MSLDTSSISMLNNLSATDALELLNKLSSCEADSSFNTDEAEKRFLDSSSASEAEQTKPENAYSPRRVLVVDNLRRFPGLEGSGEFKDGLLTMIVSAGYSVVDFARAAVNMGLVSDEEDSEDEDLDLMAASLTESKLDDSEITEPKLDDSEMTLMNDSGVDFDSTDFEHVKQQLKELSEEDEILEPEEKANCEADVVINPQIESEQGKPEPKTPGNEHVEQFEEKELLNKIAMGQLSITDNNNDTLSEPAEPENAEELLTEADLENQEEDTVTEQKDCSLGNAAEDAKSTGETSNEMIAECCEFVDNIISEACEAIAAEEAKPEVNATVVESDGGKDSDEDVVDGKNKVVDVVLPELAAVAQKLKATAELGPFTKAQLLAQFEKLLDMIPASSEVGEAQSLQAEVRLGKGKDGADCSSGDHN